MKRRDVRRALYAASRAPVPPPSAQAEMAHARIRRSGEAFVAEPAPGPRARRRRPISRVVVAWSMVVMTLGGFALWSPFAVEVQLDPGTQVSAPAVALPVPSEPVEEASAITVPTMPGPVMTETPPQTAPPSPLPLDTAPMPSPERADPAGQPTSAASETPAWGYAGATAEYEMSLWARIESDGVHASWSVFDAGEFESYVVIQADGAAPEWPTDAQSRVVGRVSRGGGTALIDSEPWAQRPVYRVVAVDGQQREVGRSRAVTAEDGPPSGSQRRPGGEAL